MTEFTASRILHLYAMVLIVGQLVACTPPAYKSVSIIIDGNIDESGFVKGITTFVGQSGIDKVCVEVMQRPFWQFGDKADQLMLHLIDNTQINVAGEVIPEDRVSSTVYLTLTMVYVNGKIAGNHGGNIVFCFDPGNLKIGKYPAGIEIQARDGTKHQYQWEIEVEETTLVSTPSPGMPPIYLLPTLTLTEPH